MQSCENLPSDVECAENVRASSSAKDSAAASGAAPHGTSSSVAAEQLTGQHMDSILLQLEQGVEVALHRAKLWSKYSKDVMSYVEKHCHLEMEYAKNVAKLAQTMKSTLKEEVSPRCPTSRRRSGEIGRFKAPSQRHLSTKMCKSIKLNGIFHRIR